VAAQDRDFLAAGGVPDARGLVAWRRDDARAVGAEGGGLHIALVAGQHEPPARLRNNDSQRGGRARRLTGSVLHFQLASRRMDAQPNTTLADLFTLLVPANPFSAVRASLRW
jgi:hypothetical protein